MNQIIEERVTVICELGCVRVREVITALAQGEATSEVAQNSAAERAEILRELQAIMAVYDERKSGPC
jgi:hypothetical protein